MGLIIFLAVLPLINALFDTISYAVTLVLTQRGLRMRWLAVALGLLDFVLAGALFLGLGMTLVLVIDGMNRLAGVTFLDVTGLLNEIADWREYWWLYAMVFSTMLPTAVHFALASFSLQAVVPRGWRQRLWVMIERRKEDLAAGVLAPVLLGSLWLAVLCAPFAVCIGIGWVFGNWLEWLGKTYLGWLFWADGVLQ